MENFHIANQPLDLAYANPATLLPLVDSRLGARLRSLVGSSKQPKRKCIHGVLESMTINGQLYGLPYFVSMPGHHRDKQLDSRQSRHHP